MQLLPNIKDFTLVLASKSPRRQELLKGLDLTFEVRTKEVDESFPEHLKREEIPMFLSAKKAEAFLADLAANELLITADTVVWVENEVLNKAESREEALAMLHKLNGRSHTVYTGVTLATQAKQVTFSDSTKVTFAVLTEAELMYYVDHFKPYDKAGAYGIQEFIGYMGIVGIEGSYFNVMGLPVQKLYEELKKF
jgi:septum formation protein